MPSGALMAYPPTHLKSVYLFALLGGFLLGGAGLGLQHAFNGARSASVGLLAAAAACFILVPVFGLRWLHETWSWVARALPLRRGRISGRQAVGLLFVPLYNVYWIFVANVGLCDALDEALRGSGEVARARRALVLAACICQVVPLANIVIAPFLWYGVMLEIDRLRLATSLLTRGS